MNANFRNVRAGYSNIRVSQFYNADFRGANLEGVDFAHSNFSGANFKGADLNGAFVSSRYKILKELEQANFNFIHLDDGEVKSYSRISILRLLKRLEDGDSENIATPSK